jgi:hypothetical protein
MALMLSLLILDFVKASDKRNAEKIYRIHWDGDFFNMAYVNAWIRTIEDNADVQFWVYTRNAAAAVALHKAGLTNLSLYFSGDPKNYPIAEMLNRTYGIKIAFVAETFAESQEFVKNITGKVGAKCPEQFSKSFPLINAEGSACARCRLCVDNKANISFSRSKK